MNLPLLMSRLVWSAKAKRVSPDLMAVAEAPCLWPTMSAQTGGFLKIRDFAWCPCMRQRR